MFPRNPRRSRFGGGRSGRTKGKAKRERRSLSQRTAVALEWLEPRYLLVGQPWDDVHTAHDAAGLEFVDSQVLASLRTPQVWTDEADVDRFLLANTAMFGASLAENFTLSYGYRSSSGVNLAVGRFDLPAGMSVLDTTDALNRLDLVEWAQPNYYNPTQPQLAVNDPRFSEQPYLNRISLPQAWDATTGNPNVVIAVLDSGVLKTHHDFQSTGRSNLFVNVAEIADNNIDDDLNGKIDDVSGWDFVSKANGGLGDNDPSPVPVGVGETTDDTEDHGTAVASVAAGLTNNAFGIAGVAGGQDANTGAKILPVRVFGEGNTIDSIVEGFKYAARFLVSQGGPLSRLIINFSITFDSVRSFLENAPAMATALDMAYNAGALIVKAAGNGGSDNLGDADTLESRLGEWIHVAATDQNDAITRFSNYGVGVDIAAPGRPILVASFDPGPPANWSKPETFVETHAATAGTSFSAPIVAGVAALIWSQHPEYTRDMVVARLLATADPIDAVTGNARVAGGLGHGRVNALQAVTDTFAVPAPMLKEVRLKRDATTQLVNRLEVVFTEVLAPAFANNVANYQLVAAGPDGQFGTADDGTPPALTTGYELAGTDPAKPKVKVLYRVGSNEVVLNPDSPLLPGKYRLQLSGLQNPFGTPLAGDVVHEFTVSYTEGRTGDVINVDLK